MLPLAIDPQKVTPDLALLVKNPVLSEIVKTVAAPSRTMAVAGFDNRIATVRKAS